MKFSIHILLLALFAVLVLASTEQKPVVVSYPKDTPQSVLDAAMDAIKKAVRTLQTLPCLRPHTLTSAQGGVITHEYHLIKGFAAKASDQALETVQALGNTNSVVIEQDQVMSITNDKE